MGAGVAELMDRLAAVNVLLGTAADSAELLVQKAALEAALKAAQAKKSEDAAAAGAYGLFCSFHARAALKLPKSLRSTPTSPLKISHTIHSPDAFTAQARRRRLKCACSAWSLARPRRRARRPRRTRANAVRGAF